MIDRLEVVVIPVIRMRGTSSEKLEHYKLRKMSNWQLLITTIHKLQREWILS